MLLEIRRKTKEAVITEFCCYRFGGLHSFITSGPCAIANPVLKPDASKNCEEKRGNCEELGWKVLDFLRRCLRKNMKSRVEYLYWILPSVSSVTRFRISFQHLQF
jgi:hypothetical protein